MMPGPEPPVVTTVVVVRHGETDWNRHGRMQGWAPTPLNELGREQARAAGEHLAERFVFDRAVVSDLHRTRETAALVRESVALGDDRVRHASAWRERDVGVYQGLTYEDMYERFPAFALGEAAVEAAARTPEGGESLLEMRDRVLDGWRTLLDRDDDGTVLVVTHGGPIHSLLGHVKGLGFREAFLEHSMANCGVTVLDHDGDPDATTVLEENGTAWDG